jgi:hypothetical protein
VYHEYTKIDLPEVQGTRAIRDFFRAVLSIIPEFSTYWVNDIVKTRGQDGPDLYRIIKLFQDHRRHLAVEKRHILQLTFITFQGQPPQEENHSKNNCLYEEPHRYKECPYLIKEKRPTG